MSNDVSADSNPETRPCVYCGRLVEQSGGAGRPFRYCRDNSGACQRSARNNRMRERNSPGLSGQVARAWELVERLELMTTTLGDALHAELSPAGVERQTAAVRAEAAAHVAGAHGDRDDARAEAQTARAEAARLTDALATANAQAAAQAVDLAESGSEIATLTEALAEVTDDRDAARAAASADAARRVAVEAERDRTITAAAADRDRALAAAEEHRSLAERLRAEADHALRQLRIAVAKADAAVSDADAARGRLAATAGERDAATLEAQRLRGELSDAGTAAQTAADALAQEKQAHLRTGWERDIAQKEAAAAGVAAEALRVENLARVTEAAELRGALAAAKADLREAREAHGGQAHSDRHEAQSAVPRSRPTEAALTEPAPIHLRSDNGPRETPSPTQTFSAPPATTPAQASDPDRAPTPAPTPSSR